MNKRKAFKASELVLVAKVQPPDDPPLTIGDRCTLNSGSPPLLVLDWDLAEINLVTVGAWGPDEIVQEWSVPRACVRRVE